MSIWLSLLIPIIGAIILLVFFRKALAWWEVLIPMLACIAFIAIFKFTVQTFQMRATEYHGAIIIKARYYEYYSTWVTQTCSYTTTCCCNSKGQNCQTTTHYYDCSYCSEHQAKWEVVNSLGESWEVSEDYYNYLKKKWSATPQFVALHRDIDYHGGCGRDGNAYDISWNSKPETAEATTTEHAYENRIKAAHSAFDYPEITNDDKKRYKLFEYPEVKGISQETVLGLDSVKWISGKEIDSLRQWSKFLNGYLGPRRHARIFTLFFVDQPQLAAFMQEAYWSGGNDNELIVCIGLSQKDREIKWVKPFSWTPKREIIPAIRQGINDQKYFHQEGIAKTIWNEVDSKFKRRHFEEFSYISVDPPTWSKWVTFFITLIITASISYWSITNDIDADNDPLNHTYVGNRRGYGRY